MTKSILSYQQEDSVRLLCEIDLEQLFPPSKKRKREREKFEEKWKEFLESVSCNKDLFDLKGDLLEYQSEQLIPSKPEISWALGSDHANCLIKRKKNSKNSRFIVLNIPFWVQNFRFKNFIRYKEV
jgi:tRNA nucleotidyltransferase/poly(A) polymerase